MNIVFWFLIILALVGVWFTLAPLFKHVGFFFKAIVDDTVDEINNDHDDDREEYKE